MTSDTNDMLRRLRDLQGLSKEKKAKLSKPERDEILAVLSSLCTADRLGYSNTLKALPDFPPGLGAELLASAWPKLSEAECPVRFDLKSDRFVGSFGKSLRLALVTHLLELEPASALGVLLDLCRAMKPSNKAIPTAKDLRLLRRDLIETAGLALGALPLNGPIEADLYLVTSCILAAAFTPQQGSQKPLPSQLQLAIIRWVNTAPKLKPLPVEVRTVLTHAIKASDPQSRSLLAAELPTLQDELRQVLEPIFRDDSTAERATTPEEAVPAPTPDATTQPAIVAHYDWLLEIERLRNHFGSLTEGLRQSKRSLEREQQEAQAARNELAKARREMEEVRRQASAEQSSASRLTGENGALHMQIEELRAALEKEQRQLATARKHHKESLVSHHQRLEELSERIAVEREHGLAAFRNKLAAKVQTYANDLKEASDMNMTLELGEILRTQMKDLLWLLKAEGVNIEGEP